MGRRVDERQLIKEVGQHPPHQEAALSRVSLEIVRNDNRHPSTRLRTGHSRPHLLAEDIRRPFRSDPAIKPPVSPVCQPKAVHLPIIAWGFDQPLATPTLEAPDAGERWVKGKLHLILEIQVGSGQQGEQARQIGGKLCPQISFD